MKLDHERDRDEQLSIGPKDPPDLSKSLPRLREVLKDLRAQDEVEASGSHW